MRRADRLFKLVQLLRGRRLATAAWLAEKMEVSTRTIYRDIADLQAHGVPIDGEAGVGYRLVAGFDLPPLMFTTLEAQALVACVRVAQARLDPTLAAASEDALLKIMAVLPTSARVDAEALPYYAAPWSVGAITGGQLALLREAIAMRRKVRFGYVDGEGTATSRVARPLGCFHWDSVWTLGAWCEQRTAFRSFRVDRMHTLGILDEPFRNEPGRSLADYLRHVTGKSGYLGSRALRP